MQSVAIIRGDQTLLFGNHFLSARMHILPRSCCLCLLLQLPLHLWGGKGAVVNTCMQLVDLLGGSLDSSRAIKGGRRRSREVEGDRTSSVAAFTASGLYFDFSNSSYLMREAIKTDEGGNPWQSGCTRGRNLGAITRNHSQSRRHRALESVVSSASYMTARKSCTMKKPPSMTTRKK